MNKTYYRKVLRLAIYAGEIMMKNGAEIYRVEDTILRICRACGVRDTEVFATTMGIFVSIYIGDSDNDERSYTVIKRMHGLTTNMNKISLVNDFSRKFVSTDMTPDEGLAILKKIDEQDNYPKWMRLVGAAIIGSMFAMIFGGGLEDACVGAIAGFASYILSLFLSKYDINYFIHGLVCCATAAIIAVIADSLIPAVHYSPVIIGALMIYVPGVAITNAIRDFLSGDMVSGVARLAEAVITAASLAVGAGIVVQLWSMLGGVL